MNKTPPAETKRLWLSELFSRAEVSVLLQPCEHCNRVSKR